MHLRIGTRGSRLALTQSKWVRKQLESRDPATRVELVQIKTQGDKILDTSLSQIGGKGLFVKEIEEALLRNEVDLAVHSMKDVPGELPEGLLIDVFPEREDPADALISRGGEPLSELPEGSTVATSSLRRSAQLLHLRPDLNIVSLRGNVDTRLRKLESGEFQAIVLAVAGLRRLGLAQKITRIFPHAELLPAIGQGSLGLEVRKDDEPVRRHLSFLNHEPTELTVRAERALLKELEGGCQVPIAGHGLLDGDRIILQGMVAELDGSKVIREEETGPKDRPEDVGINLARKLIDLGAGRILDRIYGNA